jgi:flagellar motor switch protein FliG
VTDHNSELRGPQKAAAILLSVSSPAAEKIIARFSPEEMRRLAEASVSLGPLEPAQLRSLGAEFETTLRTGARLRFGEDEIMRLISTSTSADQAAEILSEIYQRPNPTVWQRLERLDDKDVVAYLEGQHRQTAAAILSLIRPERAASLLNHFDDTVRSDLMIRLVTSDPVTEASQRLLISTVTQDLLSKGDASPEQNAEKVAGMCGSLDPDYVNRFIAEMRALDPDLGEVLQQSIFTFPEIVSLDLRSLARLVEACPVDIIVMAIADSEEAFRDSVLSVLPARSRRMAEQEIRDKQGRQTTKDVQAARARVAATAINLIKSGKISRSILHEAA